MCNRRRISYGRVSIDALDLRANMKYLQRLIWVFCIFSFSVILYLDVFVPLESAYTTWKKVPLIFIITPTHAKLEQKADLTRLSQTLRLVPNIHWIVVEDSEKKTDRITRFLKKCQVPYTHLNIKSYTKAEYKQNSSRQKNLVFYRGTRQRNLALDWLEQNWVFPSVVYFADDDNSYDVQLFEEMRYTKKVSVWPVGLSGGSKYESLAISNGKVVGWLVGFAPRRKFAIDMAGFAVNGEFLRKRGARFPIVRRGAPETYFLEHLKIHLRDLEPRAENCTKILVWHTKTLRTRLGRHGVQERAVKKFSAPVLEV